MKTAGVSRKKQALKKQLAVKAARKAPKVKTQPIARKAVGIKRKSTPKPKVEKKNKSPETLAAYLKTPGAPSGRQSGDLQGLSTDQGPDSESVTELLEEGNPFEAGVVSGVEAAGSEESEVRTHEVLQDDVPGEYLDEVQRRYRRH
jgi:hypothetical protein